MSPTPTPPGETARPSRPAPTTAGHVRRGAATSVVVLLGVLVLAGLVLLLVRPLVDQGSKLADDPPQYVHFHGPVWDVPA